MVLFPDSRFSIGLLVVNFVDSMPSVCLLIDIFLLLLLLNILSPAPWVVAALVSLNLPSFRPVASRAEEWQQSIAHHA